MRIVRLGRIARFTNYNSYILFQENDLELWYQAMSQGNEEDVEEEEEDTSKLLNVSLPHSLHASCHA